MGAKSEKQYVSTPELGICIQAVIYKGFAFAFVLTAKNIYKYYVYSNQGDRLGCLIMQKRC
jgi:hypothetical protein